MLKRVSISSGNTDAQIELEGLKKKRNDELFAKAVCNYLESYIEYCAQEEKYLNYLKENGYEE